MVISLDRWFMCVKPIPPSWYNDSFSVLIISFMWLISIVLALVTLSPISLISVDIKEAENNGTTMCIASFNPIMTISSTAVSFILPGIIIILANVGIAKTGLRLRENTIKRQPKVEGKDVRKSVRRRAEYAKSREIKLTMTCVKLSLAFVVCWVPFVVLSQIESALFDKCFGFSIWLGWLNSAVNPVIYYTNREHAMRLKRKLMRWRKEIQMSLTCSRLFTPPGDKSDSVIENTSQMPTSVETYKNPTAELKF
ncbi:Oidioi.mRNA.OKI2018_I69.chr1.g102.t1.cds [Oikopleura dioica]|uniref:Oidioi.mRNA.OKI2018_I69.chr1.g102.t1.cds n=1 Tax=Oikopleura dioica TaxID=34765 RepID=A0ABN7SIT8_OIKDI|nr:Oidioi.mRNA.OKI2018_I69.chr1.g102.t1.cds [Oikopleura dioica]